MKAARGGSGRPRRAPMPRPDRRRSAPNWPPRSSRMRLLNTSLPANGRSCGPPPPGAASRSSATFRSSSRAIAPTRGPHPTSSRWTRRPVSCSPEPACRPTTSRPTASSGAIRSIVGTSMRPTVMPGGSRGCAPVSRWSTLCASTTSGASTNTGASPSTPPPPAPARGAPDRGSRFSARSGRPSPQRGSSPRISARSAPRCARCAIRPVCPAW